MDTTNGMDRAAIEDLVQRLPFTRQLPIEDIGAFIQSVNLRQFPAGAIIFREGDPGDRLSILVMGEVEIVKSLGTEDERRLSFLKTGDIFGETSLLFPDRLRYASARTLTPVVLLEMLHSDFEVLMIRQPHLGYHVMREMIIRWGAAEQSIIRELSEKNMQLTHAYEELRRAQGQLIEQERIEHELALAQRIQQSILPKESPSPPGWNITTYWQPAHAVGGDFYDFIAFPSGKIGLLVGDATGKGISAALVMATTCSILRAIGSSLNEEQGLSPGGILSRANDLLCLQMPPGTFVTCLLALLEPDTGELQFANAGHCLPCHLNASGTIELRATGMPLGLIPGMFYEEKQTVFTPGDTLLLFSDALIEAHNPLGEILGTPRVLQILSSQTGETEIIPHMLAALYDFTGSSWEQEDDLTLVTLQRML